MVDEPKKTEQGRPGADDSAKRCARAVRALAEGDLVHFHGLPADCRRADVERVIAESPTPAAPYGIDGHYEGEAVWHLWIVNAKISEATLRALGQPEGILPSKIERGGQQRVYASRGLALHIAAFEPGIRRLYAFPATTFEEFRASPLSRVEVRRRRLR